MDDLGAKIRKYRVTMKLSQAEFAQRLGVTGAAVSAYENGTRQPSYDILLRIANVLGASVDELLGRSGQHRRVIDVTELTSEQIQLLQRTAEQFAGYNRLRRGPGGKKPPDSR
ncbi:MAG: helix-turn-helix transcriptional regulator [Oscillospiraceae bacterium]|nr:helix-turn-helix transcriptional regulator [Oscillospiraceae bacterium]